MSNELKVEIPAGYRWVKAGEDRNGRIWKTQQGGYWCHTIMPNCCSNYHIITPIEPPKPEAVDVGIKTSHGMVVGQQMTVDDAVRMFVGRQILGIRLVDASSVVPLVELAQGLEAALKESNERAAGLEAMVKANNALCFKNWTAQKEKNQ